MLSAAEGSPAWPTETLNQKKFWTSSASTSHQNDQPSLHADLPASETASFACAGRGNAHLAASKPLGELAPDGQRTEASDGLPEAPPPRELLSVGSVRCRQGGRCHPCDFFWKRSGSRCVNGQECAYCHDHQPTSCTPNRRQRKAGKRRVEGVLVWGERRGGASDAGATETTQVLDVHVHGSQRDNGVIVEELSEVFEQCQQRQEALQTPLPAGCVDKLKRSEVFELLSLGDAGQAHRMHGAQKEHCVAERATEELEQRKQRQHAVDLPLRALPPGCTQKLRLSKAFQWLSRTVELLAATALERAASTTSQQGATASEDVASELERISTMSRGILAEADLAAEARGLLQSAESLTELRGRMRDLEDRASWDGAKRSKEDGEKMLESRLGDLERVLSELAYREILAKVSPARLGERWSPLEKKIEFCAVEELRQSAPRSSVQERVCTAFQLAAVLPDAAERIGRELDRAPGLPAFVSDRTEIRKRMITELDCCRNMEELLGRMRGHLGV